MLKHTLLFLLISAPATFASTLYFDFTYTNSDTGATATGSFAIDSSNIFGGSNNPISELSNFSITVAGASAGNGTFDSSYYNEFSWSTTDPDPSADFNFSENLVGQYDFGTSNGDFNFFTLPEASQAPDGVFPYTLGANNGEADSMFLTSLQEVSAAPEPAGLALTGLGLLAMIGAFRRRAFGAR